jgi:hypothetical protein
MEVHGRHQLGEQLGEFARERADEENVRGARDAVTEQERQALVNVMALLERWVQLHTDL